MKRILLVFFILLEQTAFALSVKNLRPLLPEQLQSFVRADPGEMTKTQIIQILGHPTNWEKTLFSIEWRSD